MNRELCFLVRAECQCAAMCITFLGVSCGTCFWVSKRERERSNRVEEGERAAQYGREGESTKRESVQCVTLQKGVTVLNITEIDFQSDS